MSYRNSTAERTTITRNVNELDDVTGNIFESVAILSKRSRQISVEMKEELMAKLAEFATSHDNLEEVFENHHFRYPGRTWCFLVYRKPEAPDHDSARISRRVKCEKTSKLCWKSSGIWSCRLWLLHSTSNIGTGIPQISVGPWLIHPTLFSDLFWALRCALRLYISTLSLAKNSACQNIRTPYNVKCEQILSNQ